MREFVYLSDHMLRQFAPSQVSWWNRIRLSKISGSVGASSTTLTVEAEGRDQQIPAQDLGRVVEHIQDEALWYQDQRAYPGGWVFFDAPLAFWVLGRESAAGSTVFYDVVPSGQRTMGRRRLLLQGATEHLVGHVSKKAAENPVGEQTYDGTALMKLPVPQQAASPEIVWDSSQLVSTGLELEEVMSIQRSFLEALDRSSRLSVATSTIDWLVNEVADDIYSAKVAAWMAGCARTLAIHYLPRSGCEAIVASPLYLERVPPPGEDIESGH